MFLKRKPKQERGQLLINKMAAERNPDQAELIKRRQYGNHISGILLSSPAHAIVKEERRGSFSRRHPVQQSNNAVFCFLIEPKPEKNSIFTILSKLLPVAATIHTFPRFVAYVEVPPGQDTRLSVDGDVDVADFSGSIVSLCHNDMAKLHKSKVESERAARKQPGHKSHVPATLLTTNTCVVIIGSRGFCATVARIHMEEIAPLRLKLIDILNALCELKQYTQRSRLSHDDVFIASVSPDAKDYITYNLCWVYEGLLRDSVRIDSIEDRLRDSNNNAAVDSLLEK